MTTRLAVAAAVLVLCGSAMEPKVGFAQQLSEARTGVSHPDEAPIEATPDDAPVVQAQKPSAAVPMAAAGTATREDAGVSGPVYGAYVPYTGPAVAGGATAAMTEEQAEGAVVLRVPEPAGALREGTLLRTRLKQRLSTTATAEGTRFTATLVDPVERDGRVVLPAGSTVEGVVTEVFSGRRITGGAGIHLEARSVVLPDGTRYAGRMQLIDTDLDGHTRVNNEGTLKRRGDTAESLGALGLGTGGGAAAGAVIGGGIGAAVGAGIGAGVGTVIWLKQDRQEVVPAETLLVWSLGAPMALTPERAVAKQEMGQRVSGNPDAMVVGAEQ